MRRKGNILKYNRPITLPHSHAHRPSFVMAPRLKTKATIIKSTLATETTLAIIETFTKLRQLARAMQQANDEIAKGGELPTAQEQNAFKNLMDEVFADPMPISVQRMTFGVNLGFFKWELETTRERKG